MSKYSYLSDITNSCTNFYNSDYIADVDLYSCCIGNPQPHGNKPCNMKRFKALLHNKEISKEQYQTLNIVYKLGVVNKKRQLMLK